MVGSSLLRVLQSGSCPMFILLTLAADHSPRDPLLLPCHQRGVEWHRNCNSQSAREMDGVWEAKKEEGREPGYLC